MVGSEVAAIRASHASFSNVYDHACHWPAIAPAAAPATVSGPAVMPPAVASLAACRIRSVDFPTQESK